MSQFYEEAHCSMCFKFDKEAADLRARVAELEREKGNEWNRAERAERARDDARAELEHASAANKGWEHQLRAMVTRTEKVEKERDEERKYAPKVKVEFDEYKAIAVGWRARAEKAEAACAAMRAALQRVFVWDVGVCDGTVSPYEGLSEGVRVAIDAALKSDAGKGWVSPEQAGAMRTALRNAAGTLRFVIQRGHESGQPSAWLREPAEWCDAALAEPEKEDK